jgi:aspartate/methionine/tyrosine aminotransferase
MLETIKYKVYFGPDKQYIAFKIDGNQEVAVSKEKTIEALALKLYSPGKKMEVMTGERRGFLKIGQDELLKLKDKLKSLNNN